MIFHCFMFLLFLSFFLKKNALHLVWFFFLMQAPSTNWVHVMENLDHEGFNVPDEAAFCLLMSIYAHACKVFVQRLYFWS